MNFASLQFLIFITVFTALFMALARTRAFLPFLLIASYVFYGWWDYRFCGLLALTTVVDHACGWRIGTAADRRTARLWLAASLTVNLGVLFFFKYFGFFVESAERALASLGLEVGHSTLSVVLPVGISFFTFQNLSYSLDVYAGRLKPERSLLTYAAFVAFFPQLVAGPIVRARDLLPQIAGPAPDVPFAVRLAGLEKIAWGFFLKLALADNAASVVDARFAAPDLYNAAGHIIGLVCFSLQIYGDFAGYSLIAIGLAQIYGYRFCENFRRPYFADGFSEFWRRWHISLSSWFRDYVYIPLGGGRTLRLRVRNVVLTMLVSGLWHGASWTFVLWGGLHAALMLAEDLWRRLERGIRARFTGMAGSAKPDLALRGGGKATAPGPLTPLLRPVAIVLVFLTVTLTWLPFRADSVETVRSILGIIAAGDLSMPDGMQQSAALIRVALAAMLVLAVDVVAEAGAGVRWAQAGTLVRSAACSSLIVLILLIGSFQNRAFIYFQF